MTDTNPFIHTVNPEIDDQRTRARAELGQYRQGDVTRQIESSRETLRQSYELLRQTTKLLSQFSQYIPPVSDRSDELARLGRVLLNQGS